MIMWFFQLPHRERYECVKALALAADPYAEQMLVDLTVVAGKRLERGIE